MLFNGAGAIGHPICKKTKIKYEPLINPHMIDKK